VSLVGKLSYTADRGLQIEGFWSGGEEVTPGRVRVARRGTRWWYTAKVLAAQGTAPCQIGQLRDAKGARGRPKVQKHRRRDARDKQILKSDPLTLTSPGKSSSHPRSPRPCRRHTPPHLPEESQRPGAYLTLWSDLDAMRQVVKEDEKSRARVHRVGLGITYDERGFGDSSRIELHLRFGSGGLGR
jgi:hypothetical protein